MSDWRALARRNREQFRTLKARGKELGLWKAVSSGAVVPANAEVLSAVSGAVRIDRGWPSIWVGLLPLVQRGAPPLPYLVAFVWVGYHLVKAIRRHRRGALVLALSTITLGLAAAGYMAATAATAERAKREAADAESLHRVLMERQREDLEDCLSKTPTEQRSTEVRRLVMETGRPLSVIERHFDEYASPEWNCGVPATLEDPKQQGIRIR